MIEKLSPLTPLESQIDLKIDSERQMYESQRYIPNFPSTRALVSSEL